MVYAFHVATSSSNPASEIGEPRNAPPERPAAILRGGTRGLEIVVDGTARIADVADSVLGRLAEAPDFFRGCDVRIRVDDGPLAPGCLAQLDDIAGQFGLRIVEVGARTHSKVECASEAGGNPAGSAGKGGSPWIEAVPQPSLAAGSAPAPTIPDVIEADSASELSVVDLAPALDVVAALELEPEPDGLATRNVVGPVRSGVILEHRGHLVIFGDVNPGAEVRAEGNIIVLGRLRGTAHAGIATNGFIIALRLQPQQLRIGRHVARASDSDTPDSNPEIAHVAGGTIVVERYLGRLPNGLATRI